MEEFLSSQLFKGGVAVIALLVILKVLIQVFSKPKKPPGVNVEVKCRSCGWTGTVGKYNKRCSSCNETNLQILKNG